MDVGEWTDLGSDRTPRVADVGEGHRDVDHGRVQGLEDLTPSEECVRDGVM